MCAALDTQQRLCKLCTLALEKELPRGSCSLFRKGYLGAALTPSRSRKQRLKAIRDEASCSTETSVLFQQCPAMGH